MTLDKHYAPADIEQKHYQQCEQLNLFEPQDDSTADPFAIMMPPPNVTGTLHLGHVLDNTLPDMLVRRARMQGKNALYQPGTDHASIAVHVVLDRQLAEKGQNRFDLGREKFLEKAREWKDFSAGTISNQMRRIGVSAAWQRERFTMDDAYSSAVEHVFIELYNRGLIYRGQRLVNWDPDMQTAVSDLEVKHKEVQGKLWHFKYPFAEGQQPEGFADNFISIATTRPETILADGAVAINPTDPRAAQLVGRKVVVPIVEREIPIIADDYVDPEYGSGMVKITAAHDFNDFEVYKRHKDSVEIPLINLMTPTAHMNENCPAAYVGLDRFAARQKVVADFTRLGLFIKVDDNPHTVPTAERNDTILEPYLTNQWFVRGKPLAEKCLEVARSGKVRFLNKRDEKIYYHWLENIEDWCISRQLWWGHRIPAWHHSNGTIKVQSESPGEGWTQDPDILDTWFSSALWPFATQHWPHQTQALSTFFPGKAIMPGPDILFFWVIRMMMMSLELTGKVPFEDIYTHAIIRDEHGQKMSKSKGNVIDPMDFIEKYGADALRFSLVSQSALGQDIKLAEGSVEQARNFCTKLWNATRYALMNEVALQADFNPQHVHNSINQWVLSELRTLIEKTDDAFAAYRFNEVGSLLYHFTWDIFCDWYLELTKPVLQNGSPQEQAETRATAAYVLDALLRLLNPVMPFITEELWAALTGADYKTKLMVQSWPLAESIPPFPQAQTDVAWLVEVIGAIRTARSESKVPPKTAIAARVRHADGASRARFEQFSTFFNALARVENIHHNDAPAGDTDAVAVAQGLEIILPLEGIIDFAAERARRAKEADKLRAEIEKIDQLLNNAGFVARAPAQVVEQNKTRRAELLENLQKLEGAAPISKSA